MFPQEEVALKAPIHNPQKVICIGMNYVDHCTEQGIPVPKEPLLFSKFPSAITDPNGQVIHPMETEVGVVTVKQLVNGFLSSVSRL